MAVERPAVLFLSSNRERRWLDVDREARRLRQALASSPFGDRPELHVWPGMRVTDLGPALEETRPAVVHFSGHGQRGGRLVLWDQEDATMQGVGVDAIAHTLAAFGPRLVVLNACHSAPLASALTARGVRFVVGTGGAIPDGAALAFSEVLYRMLARGSSLEEAFELAQDAAELQLPKTGHLFALERAEGADPTDWRLVRPPAPGAGTLPLQVVLLLDVYEDRERRLDTVRDRLPHERHDRIELRLSAEDPGLPRLRPGDDPVQIDWPRLGQATQALYAALQRRLEGNTAPVHFYVSGFAPLPLFAQLGFLLSGWSPHVTVFNWYRDAHEWRAFALEADPGAATLFEVRGLEPGQAEGRVAVYLAARDVNVPEAAMARFVRARGREVAGTVSLTTGDELTATNVAACASELSTLFSRLPTVFPNARGVDLFVRGPAALAFCAGRAVNPNQLELDVPNHSPEGYLPAIQLPWRGGGSAPIAAGSEALARRQARLAEVIERISQLRSQLGPDRLGDQGLRVHPEPVDDDGPYLDAGRGELRFGHRLLDALAQVDDDVRQRMISLFVLHGLYHLDHGVDSAYRALGHATPLLAEADALADAFALRVSTALEADLDSPHGVVALRDHLTAHLEALAMLDRMVHGERIRELSERRLGRYLVGALQRSRAEALSGPEGVSQLLGARLSIALAPLYSRVDRDGSPVVVHAGQDARLYLAIDGRMCSDLVTPGEVEPGGLIEAVEATDLAALGAAMDLVVAQNAKVLLP